MTVSEQIADELYGLHCDIGRLERENAKLQDENVRLRSCLSDDAENARMIMSENTKLRELVRDMWLDLQKQLTPPWSGEYEQRMHEMGMEVDG